MIFCGRVKRLFHFPFIPYLGKKSGGSPDFIHSVWRKNNIMPQVAHGRFLFFFSLQSRPTSLSPCVPWHPSKIRPWFLVRLLFHKTFSQCSSRKKFCLPPHL